MNLGWVLSAVLIVLVLALAVSVTASLQGRWSRGRLKRVKREFEREYMFREPWSEYIVSCGLTRRFIVERSYRGTEEGKSSEEIRAELIIAGEDPDEWCILVGLRVELPEGLALPEVYKGVEVFTRVIGEIRPL